MNEQHQTLLLGLQEMFETGCLSDITLIAEETRVCCHRVVLAASSPYFRAMFTSDVSESGQREVALQGVQGSVLHELVSYLYRGHVVVTPDNVEGLMTAASMLQVDGLVEFLQHHMVSELTLDNCVEVLAYADFHNLSTLRQAVKEFVLNHFSELMENEALNQLPVDVFRELLEADELMVDGEEAVYEALVQWTRHDIEDRHKHFTKLFPYIRLALLPKDYIRLEVQANPLVERDPYSRSLLISADMYRLGCSMSSALGSQEVADMAQELTVNARRRHGMYSKALLLFSGGTAQPGTVSAHDQRSFTAYDPDTGTNYYSIRHHPMYDFKYKIDHYRLLVTDGGGIYFVGGIYFDHYRIEEHHGEALKAVLQYDQREATWKPCADMESCRCAHAACSKGDKLYVFGGYSTWGLPAMDKSEVYDCTEDEWRAVDTMPVGIAHHAAAVHKEEIYLFGGIDDEGVYLNTVLRYRCCTDTWNILSTQLAFPRAQCAAFSFSSKLYVLGGANQVSHLLSVEIYSPETDRWHLGEDFPEERKFTSATILGASLYVCGGVRQSMRRTVPSSSVGAGGAARRRSTVEVMDLHRYDLISNTWHKVADLVDLGSNVTCAAATLNLRLLQESASRKA